jgi:hypothetical protein
MDYFIPGMHKGSPWETMAYPFATGVEVQKGAAKGSSSSHTSFEKKKLPVSLIVTNRTFAGRV